MNHLDWGKAINDVKAIKEHFASKGNEVSIMGFCMGGALAFASLASIQGFKNGAVFYGIPDLNTFKV
jgi:carboxymethylenebutenolidase